MGIFGGALVVLLWFYLLSLALTLGAEVDAMLTPSEVVGIVTGV